jgi:hypothetical protein
MATMIQIRNVPEAPQHLIQSRAALTSMSLSDYRAKFARSPSGRRPTPDELRARLERLSPIDRSGRVAR